MAKSNVTVVFQGIRKVALETRPVPQPKQGQLLIRTRSTLISTGTELSCLSGDFPPNSVWDRTVGQFPRVAGYSNIGEVIDIGDSIDKKWIGRRVCTYRGGFHAQYIIGTPDTSRIVPKDISDDHATFFALARTVMNAVRCAKVQWGEAVAVYGLGILGQLTVRFCRIVGAIPVVGIDIAKLRLKYLPDLPGVIGIDSEKEKLIDRVKNLTRGRLVDVVFEVTGNATIIPQEFEIIRPQGRFVVLSSPRGKTPFDFHDLCNWPSYTIIGAHYSSQPKVETKDNPWTEKRNDELFFDLISNGELDIESLISHRDL